VRNVGIQASKRLYQPAEEPEVQPTRLPEDDCGGARLKLSNQRPAASEHYGGPKPFPVQMVKQEEELPLGPTDLSRSEHMHDVRQPFSQVAAHYPTWSTLPA
jgi:hypothetical protein